MLVLGLGGAAVAIVSGDLAVTISGMSLAAIVGIILNLILPDEKDEEKNTESFVDIDVEPAIEIEKAKPKKEAKTKKKK